MGTSHAHFVQDLELALSEPWSSRELARQQLQPLVIGLMILLLPNLLGAFVRALKMGPARLS
jgi:hypothetical protein